MKRYVSTLGGSLWLLLLLLVAPPAAGADAGADMEHFIVDVQGKASVKRKGWNARALVPAVYGMKLHRGDLLNLEPGARLTVVCGNATRHVIVNESSSVPCPTEGQQRKLRYSRGSAEQVPTILSPRATKLRQAPTLLRWTAVPGASGYTLLLRDAESFEKHWSQDVKATEGTELAYPKDAPAPLPGRTYLLQVTAHKPGKPSSDSTSFTLLAPTDVEALQRKEARLRTLGLPDATNRLLLASLYAHQELFAEALAQLEKRTGDSQVAAEERLSSDIYLRIGLPRMAEPHARNAYELSRSTEDVAGRLEAEEALGQIYRVLGAQKEWPRLLESALEGYLALGDSTKIEALRKQLGKKP